MVVGLQVVLPPKTTTSLNKGYNINSHVHTSGKACRTILCYTVFLVYIHGRVTALGLNTRWLQILLSVHVS